MKQRLLVFILLFSCCFALQIRLENSHLCLTMGAPCYVTECVEHNIDQEWILSEYLQNKQGHYIHRNWWARNKTAGRVHISLVAGVLTDETYHRCGTPIRHEANSSMIYYYYCSKWSLE